MIIRHVFTIVILTLKHSYIAGGLGGRDGTFVVDLTRMKSMSFDGTTNSAIIETGCRIGDVLLFLGGYGRAIPHGRCTYVGLGGHSGELPGMLVHLR